MIAKKRHQSTRIIVPLKNNSTTNESILVNGQVANMEHISINTTFMALGNFEMSL